LFFNKYFVKVEAMTQKVLSPIRGSTLFLRAAGVAVGAIALAICIFALPLTWQAVAAEYPSITYVFYLLIVAVYIAATLFFFALHQAFRLLSYVDKKQVFSRLTVRALKRISYFAVAISVVFAACLPLFYVWAQNDDAPGLVVVGMFLVAAPLTVAVFAGVLQQLFAQAIAIKSENDLTV
jgi:hypothetical protein